ncbi:GNAT family N-acetyltransferase [Brachyspira hyodysenteriae]|uniref:GNAT family N-acetyltransferase n=1 Tax=Brachyspira hyodysenteriae TaxID=159 RepID=UPI0022CD7231|nr:GNAT family N-acetyltransferase [Brachyspira hyodysenteriae]MCZ9873941.1 GNAT family N-acetyltransferase [Brachyspira hyodysenteriae]MCZ9887183.1 GNAT family N-acetyltransferase [Brachyspira hyodysenteriae]
MKKILETDRLILRELEYNKFDYAGLSSILKDKETMYAYEHAFSDDEVNQWFNNQINRYKTYGFGLWACILKENNEFIGQCGLTIQKVDKKIYDSYELLEIGYLFNKNYWHKGFAIEAAIACKNYAFNVLKEKRVYSIIRDNNKSSQKVAIRNGMNIIDNIVKHYYNMDMPHYIFCAEKI